MTKKAEKSDKKKPAPRSTRAAVDSRVERVAGMMARGEWVTGDSHKALAKEWRVSVSAVEKYASQASRVVMRGIGDAEQIRAWGLSLMQRLTMAAVEDGDIKTAMHGTERFMVLAGVDAPQKVAITNAAGEDLPAYVRKDWPIEVWNWALAQGRVVGEAEMAAKAEELAEAAKGKTET